jgi:hypothetical protein
VSPYLNLLRRDAPVALNYYNLVRPEIEFRNSIQQLQTQTTTDQQAIADLTAATTLPATGHAVGFQTHLRYFQTLGAGRGGARPTSGIQTAPARTPARAPARR